jgi:tetratricopeptide (TPR) repeat protein
MQSKVRVSLSILCLFGALLVQGCGKSNKNEEVERSLGKGDTYYKAGLYKDALAHYKEALALAPNNSGIHLYAGLCSEGLGLAGDALASYDEAIRCDPKFEKAYQQKAGLLLSQGKAAEVENLIQGLDKTPGLEALIPFLTGEMAKAKNDWPKALESYEKAHKLRPESREVSQALALAYQKTGKVEESIRILADLQKSNPDDIQSAAQLAALYEEKGDLDSATRILTQIVEKQPSASTIRSALANVYLQNGKIPEAEKELAEALRLNADDPMALYVSGRMALQKGDTQKALKDLENALNRHPGEESFRKALREARVAAGEVVDRAKVLEQRVEKEGQSIPLLLELADAHLFQGESERALKEAGEVLKRDAENQPARLLESLAHATLGELSSAERALEGFSQTQDPRYLAIKAVAQRDNDQLVKAVQTLKSASATELWGGYFNGLGLLYGGAFGEGLEELDRVIQKNENFGPPIYEMARAYQQLGEPHLALALYQRLAEVFPDSSKPQILAAQTLMRIGHRERAKVVLDSVLKKEPQAEGALFLLGTLQLQEQDFKAAAQVFESLAASDESGADAQVFHRSVLAKTYVFDRQYKRALEEYDKILQTVPNHASAYIEKALAQVVQGQNKEALDTCQTGLSAATDTHVLRVVEAVVLQQVGQAEQGLRNFVEEMGGGKWEQAMQKRLIPLHASLLVSAKQYDGAREVLKSSGYPENLVGYYLESVDFSEKRKAGLDRLSLGLLFTFYQWPDAALEIFSGLSKDNPKDKMLISYLGDAQVMAGRYADAYKTYALGVDLDPADPFFIEKRGQQAAKLSKFDDAVKDFSTALSISPENSALHFQLASICESQGLKEDAIASYRTVLKLGEPRLAAGATNNLAWLLCQDEKTRGEALEFAKKALEAAPANPRTGLKDGNVLDTVGWVYFLSGQIEEGRKNTEQALRALPNHPTINYHLGRIYEEMGQPKAAVIQYGKAIDFDPNFAEADDAKTRSLRLSTQLGDQ